MVQPYKPLYTVEEVAELLGTSKSAVYDFLNFGLIPYLIIRGNKFSTSKRVRGSDLEKFIEGLKPENQNINFLENKQHVV